METNQEPVKVETLLLKICHKKRKDVSLPIMQVCKTIFHSLEKLVNFGDDQKCVFREMEKFLFKITSTIQKDSEVQKFL